MCEKRRVIEEGGHLELGVGVSEYGGGNEIESVEDQILGVVTILGGVV